jgi:hypothetical protein
MKAVLKSCLGMLALLLPCGAAFTGEAETVCVKTTPVPFDEFMKGLLTMSVPLDVPVPKGYEPAPFGSEALAYSYWMLPKEASKARRSHDLPVRTGYMYGKLSLDVGYDARNDVFLGVEDAKEAFGAQGMSDLHLERAKAGNHAILFMDVVLTKVDRKIYSMYIALNVATNAAYLTYVPPKNDRALGDCYWKNFKAAVRAASARNGLE